MCALLALRNVQSSVLRGAAATFFAVFAACAPEPSMVVGAGVSGSLAPLHFLEFSGLVAKYPIQRVPIASSSNERMAHLTGVHLSPGAVGRLAPGVQRLRVRIDVSEADVARLRLRAPARIRVPDSPLGGAEWLGEVEEISGEVTRMASLRSPRCWHGLTEGAVEVDVRLFGDHSVLRIGQRVDVEVDA